MRELLCLALGGLLMGQEVSLDSLAREAMANKRRQDRDLTEYTHEYDFRFQYFDGKGKLTKTIHEEGEGFQSSQRNLKVALKWNDRSVAPAIIAKKREEAGKKLQADFERRLKQDTLSGGEGPEYGSNLFGLRFEIYRILRHCPLENLRTEVLDGRRMHVFDYQPAAAAGKEKPPLTEIRGTFWVDAADRMLRRYTTVIATGPSAGHLLWQEDHRKVLNRAWMVERILLNTNAQLPGWKAPRVTWVSSFTGYQRFGVEVEQKMEAPRPQ